MESLEKEYKDWEVLIRKATAAEKKTRSRLASQIKEVDQYSPWGHRPNLQANKHQQEKEQSQFLVKDPRQQESKPSSSAPQQQNEAHRIEGKTFRRDKKLRRHQEQKELNYPRENFATGSTPTTADNS